MSEPKKIPVVCFDIPGHGILILTPEQVAANGPTAEHTLQKFNIANEHCARVVEEEMDEAAFLALENFGDL